MSRLTRAVKFPIAKPVRQRLELSFNCARNVSWDPVARPRTRRDGKWPGKNFRERMFPFRCVGGDQCRGNVRISMDEPDPSMSSGNRGEPAWVPKSREAGVA